MIWFKRRLVTLLWYQNLLGIGEGVIESDQQYCQLFFKLTNTYFKAKHRINVVFMSYLNFDHTIVKPCKLTHSFRGHLSIRCCALLDNPYNTPDV